MTAAHRFCWEFSGGSAVRRGGPAYAQGREVREDRHNRRKRTLLLFLARQFCWRGSAWPDAFAMMRPRVTDFSRKNSCALPGVSVRYGLDGKGYAHQDAGWAFPEPAYRPAARQGSAPAWPWCWARPPRCRAGGWMPVSVLSLILSWESRISCCLC